MRSRSSKEPIARGAIEAQVREKVEGAVRAIRALERLGVSQPVGVCALGAAVLLWLHLPEAERRRIRRHVTAAARAYAQVKRDA